MKVFLRGMLLLTLSGIVLALTGCSGEGGGNGSNNLAATDSGTVPPSQTVPPLTLPGPYTVACSNVAQDFGRMAPGENATDYWKGAPSASGAPRYVTDLLADPANTLLVTVSTPNDSTLYGAAAGKQIAYAVLACYPTSAGNPRAGYSLPTGGIVPHMQTSTDPPLLPDAAALYPMIVFSHGISGSPISGDYLSVLSMFASYGYIVVAPFHGDQRFSDNNDLGNVISLLAHQGAFNTLQTLRPLSMSAAIDLMLAHPQWRDHINATQIGGFGASIGGETLMLMGGAGMTTATDLSWTRITSDPRLKAAVGYMPYFGTPFLPAFGRDQHGLDNVTLPYLAISGTADMTAPLSMAEKGMMQLAGTRELVVLDGVEHLLDAASINDLYTWSLTFLDAQVRGDTVARQKLSTMAHVTDGANDNAVISYNGPPL